MSLKLKAAYNAVMVWMSQAPDWYRDFKLYPYPLNESESVNLGRNNVTMVRSIAH
jgi:hypothetical protein